MEIRQEEGGVGCACRTSSVGQRARSGRHWEPGLGLSLFRISQEDGPVSLCAASLLREYEGRPSQRCSSMTVS